MAKISFDVKYRQQIESGEYKVITAKEQPVRIICWDRSTTYWKIIALVLAPDGKTENPFTYDVNGKESDGCLHNHELDLFIITPEPELKENEDEKIRKALICGLSEGLSEHNWQGFGGATIDECLAWLEKQKEKVSDEFDENYKIGDYHSGLILAWVNQPSTLQPAHKYHGKNVVAIHLKKGGFRCCCVDDPSPITFEIPDGTLSPLCGKWHNEKSVEKKQQPAEYLDKDKVYTIMNKLHDLAFSHLIPINSNEYKKIGEITGDVRRLLDYPIEQKPAEWSVEKEKAVEDYANEIIKWEDAHPDWNMEVIRATAYHFFNFQPKQEWSEEDEKMMRNVYESLYAYQCDIRAGIMDKNSRELLDDVEKEKQWLKSLRPQRH